jgi:signal transduction histidine kinase
VAASFARTAAARGVGIGQRWLAPPGGAAEFHTDPAKLGLIVANLVSNAVKYAPAGSEVVVTGCRDADGLTLRVQDAGEGIQPEHRELIFERFWQLDGGVTRSYQGHGLGLSVVRALLEILGGTVEVGERGARGCVFIVRIPERGDPDRNLPLAPGGNALVFEEERF